MNSPELIAYAQELAEAYYSYMPIESLFLYGTDFTGQWAFTTAWLQPGMGFQFLVNMPAISPTEVPPATVIAPSFVTTWAQLLGSYIDPGTCPTFTWVLPDGAAAATTLTNNGITDVTIIERPVPPEPAVLTLAQPNQQSVQVNVDATRVLSLLGGLL